MLNEQKKKIGSNKVATCVHAQTNIGLVTRYENECESEYDHIANVQTEVGVGPRPIFQLHFFYVFLKYRYINLLQLLPLVAHRSKL